MMMEITLTEHLSRISTARERAGIVFTPDYVEELRNKGLRRTPEKREMLSVIDERSRAAGTEPRVAYY
jgi:hypothetical protein